MPESVRVRYAPSPTGLQHIGGLRTALFNYLFARSCGGKFILRLEDTDRSRYSSEYVENLYDTFRWLKFGWDEGPDTGGEYAPYIQSERTELYEKYAAELLRQGKAYYCFCSSERLETLRKEKEASRSAQTGYDRACRGLNPDEAEERAKTEAYVIRLKIPLQETTTFEDVLCGTVTWKNEDINPDPVLLKSDGFPTYHLANIVDDRLMKITHVMRAQEWLASTPLHVIMYRALGWEAPVFCHLPMVMGQDGKKLSKRHGATSVDEFRKNGLLPEALINYVATLGASYEEGTEIFSLEELAQKFSIEKLHPAPATFDYKKLEWFNSQYIKSFSDEALAERALPFAVDAGVFGTLGSGPDATQKKLFTEAMPLVKERANYLNEIGEKLRYLFGDITVPPRAEFVPKKASEADAARMLRVSRSIIEKLAVCAESEAEALVTETAGNEGVKPGDILMPLRVAITGSRVSPPLFASIRLIGAESCRARVDAALAIF